MRDLLMKRVSILVVLLAACRPADPPRPADAPLSPAGTVAPSTTAAAAEVPPPPASPSAPPAGWWSVTPLQGHEGAGPGLALVVSADELVFVNPREHDGVKIRPAHLERGDGHEWAWSLGPVKCVLTKDATSPRATLRCVDGPRTEAFTLEPLADGASLDALLARNRPPKDACRRAEACLTDGFAIVAPATRPNLDAELGNPRIGQQCAQAIKGMVEIFAQMKKPLPKACQ
jgi:hypothetical protein